jgi:hypothetical protein
MKMRAWYRAAATAYHSVSPMAEKTYEPLRIPNVEVDRRLLVLSPVRKLTL